MVDAQMDRNAPSMQHYSPSIGLKRKEHASEAQTPEPASTKRMRSAAGLKCDLRLWGLDVEERARMLGFYEEAKAHMIEMEKVQAAIHRCKQRLFGEDYIKEGLLDLDPDFVDPTDYESDFEYLEEADAYDQKRHDIRERMSRLERDTVYEQLAPELKAKDAQLCRVAEECANLQLCPSFAAIILRSLPRELRDQVYDHLWTDELVHDMDNRISSFTMATSIDGPAMAAIDIPVPRFANSQFVGNEFAQEAAIHYFRVKRIAEVDYRHVRAYLERAKFGPMPLLVRNVIHRLTIKIDWDMTTYSPNPRKFEYEALADSMESLRVPQLPKDVCIEIFLHQDLQFCPFLYRILEIIKPGYLYLRERNIDIKVLGWRWFILMEDDTDTASEQLDYYFTHTPEEWLDMKAEENKAIAEVDLRRKCKRTLKIMRAHFEEDGAVVRRKGSKSPRLTYRRWLYMEHNGLGEDHDQPQW